MVANEFPSRQRVGALTPAPTGMAHGTVTSINQSSSQTVIEGRAFCYSQIISGGEDLDVSSTFGPNILGERGLSCCLLEQHIVAPDHSSKQRLASFPGIVGYGKAPTQVAGVVNRHILIYCRRDSRSIPMTYHSQTLEGHDCT
ncbi:hypothetical protein WG66_008916 [Moniliophthora roreri]|nr:hypothetical protein WG66_008916 [Moniliophthora roreri]